jgi:serine/threonine-protein kinase RsbW
MKSSPPDRTTMKLVLPATHLAVEGFLVEFRQLIQAALPRRHWFTAELVAREALTNAVKHGCHDDPSRSVSCVLRLKGQTLTMVVDDLGEGFDWRAQWDHEADPGDISGRGMPLLRTLATRVRFNRKGNAVTIVKQCK